MTHTDLILIISLITVASTAGVYVIVRKIIQYTPTPQNVLTRSGGDIELADYIEPAQPLPVYDPTVSPINLIQSNPFQDSITVIEGLNSDLISTPPETISPLDSITESLNYDSLNLEPINYDVQDLYIYSILEENIIWIFLLILLFMIILSIIITYNIYINKPAITFFNKNKCPQII